MSDIDRGGATACVVMLRPDQRDCHRQFSDGLAAAGFEIVERPVSRPRPSDVLLIWNRQSYRDDVAKHYERADAKVIVAENGWIGRARDGGKLYAICLSQHNGPGSWRIGEQDRFALMNVNLTPWRESGDHILVLASRGIGSPHVRMPSNWVAETLARLRKQTSREVRFRPHPGNKAEARPLEADLEGAHAVVTWGSGAAIKAIAAGVPCFYGLSNWIGAAAAKLGDDDLEEPFLGDRMPMFRRLAWAQWSAREIASGKPFCWLLEGK